MSTSTKDNDLCTPPQTLQTTKTTNATTLVHSIVNFTKPYYELIEIC